MEIQKATAALENWIIKEHATWEETVQEASQEAAATMATVQTVILYQQSNRQFAVTSFPLAFVADRVKIDNLKKGEDPDAHYNRPLIPEHVRAISNYLATAQDYILPPLTLAVLQPLSVHVVKSGSKVKNGIIVLHQTLKFVVTDGQHRIKGIQDAIQRRPELATDAIGVTIVSENEIEKVHQDFVDCAQSKAIAPALLTAFNVRDPLAKLVREVAIKAMIFQSRIEKVGSTVGKNSVNILTMNQLRAGVAELLTGNSIQTAEALRRASAERLEGDLYEMKLQSILEFYRKFMNANNEWSDLVMSNNVAGEDKMDTRDLRERYLHFNATGLVIIGRVGYYIFKQPEEEQATLIEALAGIDWRRSSTLWDGNVIQSGGKLVTQNAPVSTAVAKVKELLGLPLTDADLRRLEQSQPDLGLDSTIGSSDEDALMQLV